MDTAGDLRKELPLNEFGEKGLFIKELELALQYHKVDMVVNSLKDMPTVLSRGMCIAAVLEREDPEQCPRATSPLSVRTWYNRHCLSS